MLMLWGIALKKPEVNINYKYKTEKLVDEYPNYIFWKVENWGLTDQSPVYVSIRIL